jgi:hypothetical protein
MVCNSFLKVGDYLVLESLTKFCTCRNVFGEESTGKREEEATLRNYILSVRVPSDYLDIEVIDQ